MKTNPPTIRVQGQGRVSSAPDTVILDLELNSEDADYGKAVADAARRLDLLRRSLPKAGLSPDMLKTGSFNVGVEEDYVSSRRVFRAYSAKHLLRLRLPFEPSQLGRVFTAVTGSTAKAKLSLRFTVSDPEEVKRRVLEDAVRSARSRAEVIAAAAGQKLGAIHAIEYGHVEIVVYSQDHSFGVACAPPPMDFDPADIESEDTVLIVWELRG